MWIFSCAFHKWLQTNEFSQLGQENGFSPVWILWCVFNPSFSVKDLFRFAQANGFSHVWVLSCFLKLVLCENEMSCGANKWPLFCVSHVMFLKITLVFKGLVTFGTGKHLPPGVNPFRNHHFVYLQRSYKCKFAYEKDLGLIILCFGTYSILLM